MLVYIFAFDHDFNVYPFQMGMLFKIHKQKESFCYDFAEDLAQEIIEQLMNYKKQYKFRDTSFLVHMFLHQNVDFFSQYMELSTHDNEKRRNIVTAWTPILFATYNSYVFLDAFLTSALHDLRKQGLDYYTCFSKEQIG